MAGVSTACYSLAPMPSLTTEYRALIRLSWPAALMQVGLMLTSVVDTLMLARVGVDALAGSALAMMWQWSFLSIGIGSVVGIDPLISQAHGRGDAPGAALAFQRAFMIALLISVPVCVALACTGIGLRLLGEPPAIADLAQQYNLLKLPTVPCFLVYTAQRQYLQGRGMMTPATWAAMFATVLNGVLDWCLIFGHLGLPALGMRGAAIASTLSMIALVLTLTGLMRGLGLHSRAVRAFDRESIAWSGLTQALRLGLPVGMQMSLEASAFSCAAFMAGWIGVLAIGAHQIVLNMAALSFMLPLGVSIGAATRVGHLIGQSDGAGLRRAVRTALTFGASIMVFAASAFTLLRHQLPRLYTDDALLIPLAAQILPVAGAFQLADGTQAVAGGVLRGMGRPHIAALANLVGYYVLALPLAYVLAFRFNLGLLGIWLALAVGLLAIASALLWWIRRALRTDVADLQVRVKRASVTPSS
jgi:MATE family multidrug resistance protein